MTFLTPALIFQFLRGWGWFPHVGVGSCALVRMVGRLPFILKHQGFNSQLVTSPSRPIISNLKNCTKENKSSRSNQAQPQHPKLSVRVLLDLCELFNSLAPGVACCQGDGTPSSRTSGCKKYIWLWLKKPVPKWNPGKWKHAWLILSHTHVAVALLLKQAHIAYSSGQPMCFRALQPD